MSGSQALRSRYSKRQGLHLVRAVLGLTVLGTLVAAVSPAQAHELSWTGTLQDGGLNRNQASIPDFWAYHAQGCEDVTDGVNAAVLNVSGLAGHRITVVKSAPVGHLLVYLGAGECQSTAAFTNPTAVALDLHWFTNNSGSFVMPPGVDFMVVHQWMLFFEGSDNQPRFPRELGYTVTVSH